MTERFTRAYTGCATGCLNTFILFVVINVALGMYFTRADKAARTTPGMKAASTSLLQIPHRLKGLHNTDVLNYVDEDAYVDVPLDVAAEAVDETAEAFRVTYESWLQFRPAPQHAKYVNDDVLEDPEFVYRRSVLDDRVKVPANAPTLDVYVFGGSTMWGFNTADQWTVASFLWSALQKQYPARKINLINFGRPMYYSSEEVVLFRRLLLAGHVPKVAIFLDGLNDVVEMAGGVDKPKFHDQLADLMQKSQSSHPSDLEKYQWVPMVRLAYTLRQRVHPTVTPTPAAPQQIPVPERTGFIMQRYTANKKLAQWLGEQYGCSTYFFWQPVPYYHYDATLSGRFPVDAQLLTPLYVSCYDRVAAGLPGVIDLADTLQEYGHQKVFVDPCHYNPTFARFLAEKMAAKIQVPTL